MMRVINDVNYGKGDDPRQLVDLLLPEEPFPLLVYFHGGCLTKGTRRVGDMLRGLAEQGVGVASVEYHLLQEAPFPTFLRDAAASVAYLQRQAAALGSDGRLFVSGASAGAYIALMLLMNPTYLLEAGADPESITGFISESAQPFAHFSVLESRGMDKRLERIDETAPIYYLSETSRLKPLLLLYYSNDMVCRPEENRLMYRSLRRFFPDADVTLQELVGGHCKPENPADRQEAFLSFIRRLS